MEEIHKSFDASLLRARQVIQESKFCMSFDNGGGSSEDPPPLSNMNIRPSQHCLELCSDVRPILHRYTRAYTTFPPCSP